MLWLWMQRVGTLAVRKPVDIYMAIGFPRRVSVENRADLPGQRL